mmetsp:Transcript_49997/g.150412  ORF Transcript_49997/g.150412 Transcript_49997/m.150412 type:complete len:212 (-) Transcript_49997:733-1368(-)
MRHMTPMGASLRLLSAGPSPESRFTLSATVAKCSIRSGSSQMPLTSRSSFSLPGQPGLAPSSPLFPILLARSRNRASCLAICARVKSGRRARSNSSPKNFMQSLDVASASDRISWAYSDACDRTAHSPMEHSAVKAAAVTTGMSGRRRRVCPYLDAEKEHRRQCAAHRRRRRVAAEGSGLRLLRGGPSLLSTSWSQLSEKPSSHSDAAPPP